MEKFDLLEGSSVLIYGAGALGKKIYNQINKIFDVRGFVDKRRITIIIDKNNIPVYQPSELVGLEQCSIIVCVHNASWHYEIAELLYNRGFSKILFLAVHKVYERDMAKSMNKAYSLFLEENYMELKNIPSYNSLKNNIFLENVIRKSEKYVVSFCNREIIFSFNGIEEHNKSKLKKEHLLYNDCPLAGFETYISLMEYFIHAEKSPDKYVSLMKTLNNSFAMGETEFLDDQWNVYQLLECEYEKGLDSFQYAPLDVAWNEKGYFNILDGHHRAAFYYVKGMQYFPIRMKKEDYYHWVNEDKIGAVIESLKISEPQVPIMHPYFTNVEYKIKEYEESTMEMVLRYVYETNTRYDSLLDASDYGGEFARSFYRSGKAGKIVSLIEDKDYSFQKALNDLYYISEDMVRVESGTLEKLQGKYQCGVICGKYNLVSLEKIVQFFDILFADEIIWQSKDRIEEEKRYIIEKTQFKSYKALGKKCVNGKLRETGVFTKNEK